TEATKFYLGAGDTVFVDANNGLPPNRWIGPRYLTVQAGNAIILNSKTDNAYWNVWTQTILDTIPLHLLQPWHRPVDTITMPNFTVNDSVNAEAHRQKFYLG